VAAPDLNSERDDIQGLVASGFGHLRQAAYVAFEITDPPAAAGWLGRIADRVTTARRSEGPALNVALSASGLQKLGAHDALDGLSWEFRAGMTDPHRRRVLGDVGESAPEQWSWGGTETRPVDLLALVYAEDEQTLDELVNGHIAEARRAGIRLVIRLDTTTGEREHFGFRDGISQPAPEGLREGPPRDTIKTGEFLLGYPNEYGLFTDRPLVDDPVGVLPPDPQGSGRGDVGRNGTYLVFRQLSQDVRGFWRFLDQATGRLNGAGAAARIELAAKMVGRWPDGAPLVLAPDDDDPDLKDANDFAYFHTDPDGLRCPLGAHVRRSHPRDSLDPNPGTDRSIAVNKRHRILRRGRKYGETLTAEDALNGAGGQAEERGLHFVCLCANIARQFEFVQHTWVNNPKFQGLYADGDPLTGSPGRTFTVPARPVRRRVTAMPEFVQTRGGGYFFLPGVRALRYLASRRGNAH
jgi:Dyp-type peroxidase family